MYFLYTLSVLTEQSVSVTAGGDSQWSTVLALGAAAGLLKLQSQAADIPTGFSGVMCRFDANQVRQYSTAAEGLLQPARLAGCLGMSE